MPIAGYCLHIILSVSFESTKPVAVWEEISSIFSGEYSLFEGSLIYRRPALLASLRLAAKYTPHAFPASVATPQLSRGYYYASNVIVYRPPASSYGALMSQRYRLQAKRWEDLIRAVKLSIGREKLYSRRFMLIRLPIAAVIGLVGLSLPVLLSYFIYMAFHLDEPSFLMVSWAALILFVIFSLSGNEPA